MLCLVYLLFSFIVIIKTFCFSCVVWCRVFGLWKHLHPSWLWRLSVRSRTILRVSSVWWFSIFPLEVSVCCLAKVPLMSEFKPVNSFVYHLWMLCIYNSFLYNSTKTENYFTNVCQPKWRYIFNIQTKESIKLIWLGFIIYCQLLHRTYKTIHINIC